MYLGVLVESPRRVQPHICVPWTTKAGQTVRRCLRPLAGASCRGLRAAEYGRPTPDKSPPIQVMLPCRGCTPPPRYRITQHALYEALYGPCTPYLEPGREGLASRHTAQPHRSRGFQSRQGTRLGVLFEVTSDAHPCRGHVRLSQRRASCQLPAGGGMRCPGLPGVAGTAVVGPRSVCGPAGCCLAQPRAQAALPLGPAGVGGAPVPSHRNSPPACVQRYMPWLHTSTGALCTSRWSAARRFLVIAQTLNNVELPHRNHIRSSTRLNPTQRTPASRRSPRAHSTRA